MADTHSSTKLQTYIMPDGTVQEILSAKDLQYVVVTADPDYRIIAKCFTRAGAQQRLAYYQKIWDGQPEPIAIIKRTSKEYIYRQE